MEMLRKLRLRQNNDFLIKENVYCLDGFFAYIVDPT